MAPNTLDCFLTPTRICGPDCIAYLTHPPDHTDYHGQPWASCSLLVHAHRVSKHLTILAQVVDRHSERTNARAADQARLSQMAPPAPK